MKNLFKTSFALLLLTFCIIVTSKDSFAANLNCYSTFYQTKNFDCIDSLADMLSLKYPKTNNFNHSNIQGIVGFFSETFQNNPEYKKLVLDKDVSIYTKSVFMAALYRGGLTKEAENYANNNSLEKLFNAYKKNSVTLLKDLEPKYFPYDNDFLIGAFMASGNKEYIKKIIGNFKTVNKDKAKDAIRMSLVKSKFGPSFSPDTRKSKMLESICMKYECKKGSKDFYRITTLSSGYWALTSLSKKHEAIKDTLIDFFENNKDLKNILFIEQNNLSNYITILPLYATNIDNKKIEAFMQAYESLEKVDARNIFK